MEVISCYLKYSSHRYSLPSYFTYGQHIFLSFNLTTCTTMNYVCFSINVSGFDGLPGFPGDDGFPGLKGEKGIAGGLGKNGKPGDDGRNG